MTLTVVQLSQPVIAVRIDQALRPKARCHSRTHPTQAISTQL